MKKRLSLWLSLSLILVIMSAISVSIFYIVMIGQTSHSIRQTEEEKLKSTAQLLAENDNVIQLLRQNRPTQSMENYTVKVANLYNLDFVVIINMKGIRLTHPDSSKIGKHFEGGDEKSALKGKEVLSTGKGTLGESSRYFIPVYDKKKQLGVIAVGLKLTTMQKMINRSVSIYTLGLIISSLISLIITSIIAYLLKRQLHNLEPGTIFQLLEERNAMLDKIQAIVFVIDKQHRIQLNNQAADYMFKSQDQQQNLLGQKIETILPELVSSHFANSNEQLFRHNGQDYLLSVSPILVREQLHGYILFLRNATEALFTIDQLAHTTTYASALQAQTHKFMNQLHVIYGLVDIKCYDELKIYLDSVLEPETETLNYLSVLIKEPLIASFFIGEREKFAERHTTIEMAIESEIPICADERQLNNCFVILRYINISLLQQKLPKTIKIKLDYQDNQLYIDYHFNLEQFNIDLLDTALHERYFQQLLTDALGEFHLKVKDEQINLSLHLNYERG